MRRYLRHVWRIFAVVTVVAVAFAGWNAVRVWQAWRAIERIEFDLAESRALLEARSPVGTAAEPDDSDVPAEEPPMPIFSDEDVDLFLLVGTDQDKPTVDIGRADAILLFLRPHGGRAPILMSLPRDLILPNPCTNSSTRLSDTLVGCGEEVSGPELLSLMVEDFAGLSVDHFGVLSFGAFVEVVDRLGGVLICVDNDLRLRPDTTLPRGCTQADGEVTLTWLRSRTPEELVDGEWRPAQGGDHARSQRQQALLVELLRRLERFRSPLELSSLVGDLSDAVALDAGLSFGEAIDIAWELRSVDPATIARPNLAVVDTAEEGIFVRIPAQSFEELLASVYGDGG